MSLISDALRKAQDERNDREPGEPAERILRDDISPIKKRFIFYGSVLVVVIVALIAITIWVIPGKSSSMKTMNVKPGTKPDIKPVTQAGTQPTQPPTASEPTQQQPPQESTQTAAAPTRRRPVQATTPPAKIPVENLTPRKKSNDPVFTNMPPKTTVAKENPPTQSVVPKQSVTRSVKSEPEPPKDASAFLQEGDGFMEERKFPQAVEAYKQSLELSTSPGVYLKLYGAFKAMRNPVLARAYVDDGLKVFPDDFLLNKISAIMHIRARDFKKALINADRAIEKNNADYALYTYQGLCHFHTGNFSEALRSFQRSLEINSDAVENYYYTGLIFDNRKEYKKALEYYTAFLKLSPKDQSFKHKNWALERIESLNKYLEQK